MSTYAIGDIQGCYLTFKKLLKTCGFNPTQDRLWLTGDLVNRGPRSLEVLRWILQHQERIEAVLGNHDLYLLARAKAGVAPKKRDTLESILNAPDRELLLDYLVSLPLVYIEGNSILFHGGLLPEWTVEQLQELAREAEKRLRGNSQKIFLQELLQPPPPRWNPRRKGHERAKDFTQILTRLRIGGSEGTLRWDFSGPLNRIPSGFHAWFDLPDQMANDMRIFGHWAALGFYQRPNLLGLDSGCVWERTLTAVRLEDGRIFQENCIDLIEHPN